MPVSIEPTGGGAAFRGGGGGTALVRRRWAQPVRSRARTATVRTARGSIWLRLYDAGGAAELCLCRVEARALRTERIRNCGQNTSAQSGAGRRGPVVFRGRAGAM